MYSSNITGQIEGVRQQSVAVLDELIARAGEFELADPPPALGRYRRKLQENAYKVLVVGEAKRGKSPFVNALIGRDILPTDVDVATSQVFNIRPSEREAYRLRFEDGSVREIPPEDLPLYGSRVMPDAGVVPAPRIIRWIEVKDATVDFNKEEPATISLSKYHGGLSILKGARVFDCATRPSSKFLGQQPLIKRISYLFWGQLFTKLLEKFQKNCLRGVPFSPISGCTGYRIYRYNCSSEHKQVIVEEPKKVEA